MNLGEIWWQRGGSLAFLDLERQMPNMHFNIGQTCSVLAKHGFGYGKGNFFPLSHA
jgi:hypothetical protein